MNVAVSALCATGAAAAFALGTAVQSRALRHVDEQMCPSASGREEEIARGLQVVSKAVVTPGWLVGAALAAGAFGLQALALHEGSLTLVQPLLVSSVLFALPASHLVCRVKATDRELVWAAVLVLALAAFFAAAQPRAASSESVDVGPAVGATVVAVAVVAVCLRLTRGRQGSRAAALLGASTGIAFAGVAALTKTVTNSLDHGVGSVFTGWQVYGLAAAGGLGVVLSQLAYRAGPISASLPAMNSVNPLASILIGVFVFAEHIRTGLVTSTVEGVSLVSLTLATLVLSRLPRLDDR